MAFGDLSRGILRKALEAYLVHEPHATEDSALKWAAPLLAAEAATYERPINRGVLRSIIQEIQTEIARPHIGSMMVVLGHDLLGESDVARESEARAADDRLRRRPGTVENPIEMMPPDSEVGAKAPPREAGGRSTRRTGAPKRGSRSTHGNVPESA